jgi:RNA polymerase sigma-70 factor (ECF subfamily)
MDGASANQDAALRLPLGLFRRAGAGHEADLVRRAQRGSADAVEALVRSHWQQAHRAAYLIVHDASAAEDIAQESLLAAVNSLPRFDSRRPLRPWLNRIVANRSLDWLRKTSREGVGLDRRPEEAAAPDAPRALTGELSCALLDLSDEDRTIVVMRHLLDMPSSEIGAALSMSPATVRTRLARALEVLREELETKGRTQS